MKGWGRGGGRWLGKEEWLTLEMVIQWHGSGRISWVKVMKLEKSFEKFIEWRRKREEFEWDSREEKRREEFKRRKNGRDWSQCDRNEGMKTGKTEKEKKEEGREEEREKGRLPFSLLEMDPSDYAYHLCQRSSYTSYPHLSLPPPPSLSLCPPLSLLTVSHDFSRHRRERR